MKTLELLKELLVLEKAGAVDSVHTAIDLTIQIHCENNGLDQTAFIEKLRLIHDTLWKDFNFCDSKAHNKQLIKYAQLIDMLA